MALFCQKCGKEYLDNATFCNSRGDLLNPMPKSLTSTKKTFVIGFTKPQIIGFVHEMLQKMKMPWMNGMTPDPCRYENLGG